MTNSTIRKANLQDLDQIISIFRESERLHVEGRPDIFAVSDDSEIRCVFERFMANESVTNLVLQAEGIVIGYARYSVCQIPKTSFLVNSGAKQATVEELVISKAWRRRGLATKLLIEIESQLLRAKIDHIKLTVFAFNKAAQSLYSTLGYSQICAEMGKNLGRV